MKSYHIVGYTFRADIWCPNCILGWARDVMREKGYTETEISAAEYCHKETLVDVGFAATDSEAALLEAALAEGVDINDPWSFDSDNFPKVIFADQIEEAEYCGNCQERIDD